MREVLDDIASSEDGVPRVAFALSGGGATGAYQAGVIKAYLEAVGDREPAQQARLRPHIIVGTSAGALNAMCLFIEQMGFPDETVLGKGNGREPYVVRLWRAIGGKNEGAEFVVGNRAVMIDILTRYLKFKREDEDETKKGTEERTGETGLSYLVRWVFFAIAVLAILLIWNPAATGWVLSRSGLPLLDPLGATIVRHAGPIALVVGVLTLALLLYLFLGPFKRALFSNRALVATLANAVRGGNPARDAAARLRKRDSVSKELDRSKLLSDAWYDRASEDGTPELILTATDLSARTEALFTLVRDTTFKNLAAEGWQVAQVGLDSRSGEAYRPTDKEDERYCARVSSSDLIRCAITSTSIPAVFPSQRIRLHPLSAGETEHDFVDGGVLNNAPVHIAIDAGASHILSIELDPLSEPGPLSSEWDAQGREQPRLLGNFMRTFGTLLHLATSEDIRKASAWNNRIWDWQHRALGRADRIDGRGGKEEKRRVRIYRVAPIKREVDTIEFNGHYASAFSEPSWSLVRWMEKGYDDAGKESVFWNATYDAYPETTPPIKG